MIAWERATSRFLDAAGLGSIKVKIIIFALLATLIPSLSMGWLSYHNNRRAIDEKISQELTSLTSHAARELDLWLRERRYDMRILASSYEVSENLEKLTHPGQASVKAEAMKRLRAYLGSVGGKFADYRELFAADAKGNVLASSEAPPGAPVTLEPWLERARTNEAVVGDAFWDPVLHAGVLIVAAPIRSADGEFLGVMGAKISFDGVDKILTGCAKDPNERLYLVARNGILLSSSRSLGTAFMASRLGAPTTATLYRRELATVDFRNAQGSEVLGTLRTVPEMEWGVLAEKNRAAAYAEISRLKNLTLALIGAVLLGIGLAAYVLGLTIVRPLDRLTQGAENVSRGDLDVTLPIHGRGEVGYMTEVFNDMVARLRKFRDENAAITEELRERNKELATLSITDSLTGLYNRTRLPELLAREHARSRRHRHAFSLLMVDIDHFKRFNDSHGHQAGDDLLQRFAGVLKSSLRSCDFAARYGGEEFLILLTETGPQGALDFGEKLRRNVEDLRFKGEKAITISVGGATYPEHADDVDTLIRLADDALYRCKREGRNRVALTDTGRAPGASVRTGSF